MKKFLLPSIAIVALVGASSSVLAEETVVQNTEETVVENTVETVVENTEETVVEEKELLRASDLIDKDNLSMQDILGKIVEDVKTNGSDSLIIKDLTDTIKDYPSLQLDLTMKFLYLTNDIFGNYIGDLVADLGSENIAIIGDALTDYLAEQKEVLSDDEYTELYTRVNDVTVQLYNELVNHVDHESLTLADYDTFKTASEFEFLSQESLEEIKVDELQLGLDVEEEIIQDTPVDSEEDAPEGAVCEDSSENITTEDSVTITETETENCVENSDGQDLTVDDTEKTEEITTVITPSDNNPTNSKPTVTEVATETLPQTGMDSSSSTTGGLVAMLLGLLTFGLYSRKKSINQ